MEVKVLAPAKINLSLDVLSKRADGYHNISTVMQAVDLYDTITITDNESGTVTISCNCEGVPCDDSNICAKAAYKFFDYCKTDVKGIHIDIDKKIPTQAGLAGGSSDGAAVILGLNNMFGTMLKPAEMRELHDFYGGDHQRLFAEQCGLFGFRGSFEDGGGFFPAGIIRLIHLFCAEQHGDGGVCERTGLRVVRAFSGFRGGGQGNGVLSPDRRRSQRSGKL